ncbi:hypothetical protein [Roseococcus microcysteis]|nr:hypothetical protein [Roseococcus microcysteis]
MSACAAPKTKRQRHRHNMRNYHSFAADDGFGYFLRLHPDA